MTRACWAENPQVPPSRRLVIYYASKNKKSGLALTSPQIDDAIPSHACTLQLRLIGLVGIGAGVGRPGPLPISVPESMAAWMDVRLCTMCAARTDSLDACSSVPGKLTSTRRAAALVCSAWFDQRRRIPRLSIDRPCANVMSIPARGGANGCSVAGRGP